MILCLIRKRIHTYTHTVTQSSLKITTQVLMMMIQAKGNLFLCSFSFPSVNVIIDSWKSLSFELYRENIKVRGELIDS